MKIEKTAKIYVAGHCGLVGSAIVRRLRDDGNGGYTNIIVRTHKELDLLNQSSTKAFFEQKRPEYVFLAAAKVGGIHANKTYPADFIYQNIQVQNNVIQASHQFGVKWLCFLGSSCIYPRDCPQPIKEEYFLSGPLEPTNEPYAIAKIAGIELCKAYNNEQGTRFMSVMPTNLYGPNDNYNLANSHVLPALISKTHQAKITGATECVVWGSGNPKREFLYVDDMADACVFLMEQGVGESMLNIGTGRDITIRELAEMVRHVVGYGGELVFDIKQPDGTPRKQLDVSRLTNLGWVAKTSLREGIAKTYQEFLKRTN